jgi:hypothetical protein
MNIPAPAGPSAATMFTPYCFATVPGGIPCKGPSIRGFLEGFRGVVGSGKHHRITKTGPIDIAGREYSVQEDGSLFNVSRIKSGRYARSAERRFRHRFGKKALKATLRERFAEVSKELKKGGAA